MRDHSVPLGTRRQGGNPPPATAAAPLLTRRTMARLGGVVAAAPALPSAEPRSPPAPPPFPAHPRPRGTAARSLRGDRAPTVTNKVLGTSCAVVWWSIASPMGLGETKGGAAILGRKLLKALLFSLKDPRAPVKGFSSGERVPADPADRAPPPPHHRGAAPGPRAAVAARGPPEPSSAGQSAAVSSAAAMLPAARALPPRLPRRPPPAWRWAPAGPPAAGLRALSTGRARRSEALAGAPLDTAAKEYSPKVRQLVRDIAGLTLLEVADLNALLKETLKIPDVAVMPAAAASLQPSQAAPQEEEEVPLKKEKTHFTVRLTELKPADKVKLIKEVKNFVPGVNLVQAKKLVESLPQEIKANASKEEAEKIKAALEAAGGTVVLE
ncbi:large ribosomal subunit protein bL12m isoform X1 [Chroicocephalus ridibundus]|uniref:large ribosomal subunit protein bL12m isoform X1 n=1 Tax=Chroicocephalus ridibundus TaxID=1192867 RepID=UPI002FDE7D88